MGRRDLKRRVVYVTGTRADYGLMRSTLLRLHDDPRIELQLVVTGMHLDPRYGSTVREIEASGLRIATRIPVDLTATDGGSMARAIGVITVALVEEFSRSRPDLIIVLGDRGEMLAATVAATHLEIPVAHIHGGERSGTIDEPVRHAISKLAHLHFVATEDAKLRLARMGEYSERIWITGAPGLDDIVAVEKEPRRALVEGLRLDPAVGIAMCVYHPVLSEIENAAAEIEAIISATKSAGLQILALAPNSDAGSERVRNALERLAGEGQIKLQIHLERRLFLSWLAACDVLVGNSSAGIIEAASFGTPVVNVGTRQSNRLRNENVIDVVVTDRNLAAIIRGAATGPRYSGRNVYGDGHAGQRIAELVATLNLTKSLVVKSNAY